MVYVLAGCLLLVVFLLVLVCCLFRTVARLKMDYDFCREDYTFYKQVYEGEVQSNIRLRKRVKTLTRQYNAAFEHFLNLPKSE